jgi:hypothetical protein
VTIWLSASVVAFAALWIRSYVTQDELRWMHGGVHRHLESARGYIMFVSTSGCASADYFVWASSPDLSYGRAGNWYEADDDGRPRWHLRVHCAVPVLASGFLAFAAVFRRVRKTKHAAVAACDLTRTPTTHGYGSAAPTGLIWPRAY